MKVFQVLWMILARTLAVLVLLLFFPLFLLYAGVRIIGGMASKIR